MNVLRLVALLAIVFQLDASADIFSNTPFDPKTWKKTFRNTPFDPRTWKQSIEDISNADSVFLCVKQAKYFEDTVKSERPLTHAEKFYLRPFFGDLVDRVTLAQNVPVNNFLGFGETSVGEEAGAKTFGHRIYFGDALDRTKTFTLARIAHELVHSWQYEQLGSDIRKFCRAYADGYKHSHFNYESNPLEHAAFDFQYMFLNWMQTNHPNPNSKIKTIKKLAERFTRTVRFPEHFIVPEVEYAAASLSNTTNCQITLSYQFGNSEYRTVNIAPGRHEVIWWRYEGGSRLSPELRVKLDVDLGPGDRRETYVLSRLTTTKPSFEQSKRYQIINSYNELQVVDESRIAAGARSSSKPIGTTWKYDGGAIEKVGDSVWEERGGYVVLRYQETNANADFVELKDITSGSELRLYQTYSTRKQPHTGHWASDRTGLMVLGIAMGTQWVYSTGEFTKMGEASWVETDRSGGRANFEQVATGENYVELYDESRDIGVVLSNDKMFIRQPGSTSLDYFRPGQWR